MDFITKMNKSVVLETLKTNLEAHKAIFHEAVEIYRVKVAADLHEKLDLIQAGKPIQHYISLPVPEEHTDDYETVIAMLEAHVDDVVELSQEDYRTYIQNNWAWQRNFLANTTSYTTNKK